MWYFATFVGGVVVTLAGVYGYLVYRFFINEDDHYEPMVGE